MSEQRIIRASVILTAVLGNAALAQSPQATILNIEMQNVVQYNENFANLQRNGTSSAMEVPITAPVTFYPGGFIADIVAINGVKSKGTTVTRLFFVGLSSNPSGSQAVADVNRFQMMEIVLELQQADGTSIGTLVLSGVTGGIPPPGAPKSGVTGNFAVVGGTGAFLGARGQAATMMNSGRSTSTFENPINRRSFPAGLWKIVIQLIPMTTPEVVLTSTGPAIVHSADNSPVTLAKPAHADEVLTLYALGLGPTRPGVDPDQAFTAEPDQMANSPIQVLVNGQAADLLYAGGYPGAENGYQVNFRVPADTIPGSTSIQLTAAWVAGTAVRIPVQ